MLQIFGIKNCDTVKKAIKWLNDNQVNYEFNDFKKSSPDTELVAHWLEQVGADVLINRRGTTWRKLTDSQKAISDKDALIELIQANTSLVKRPVVVDDKSVSVGFNAATWQDQFSG